MIVDALRQVTEGHDLTEETASAAMEDIMTGQATPAQIAGLLIGLRMKGETSAEIAGLARIMRQKALPVKTKWPDLLDTCGTGGTGRQAINVSTGTSFIASAAGAKVAKHGNRGFTRGCGSFDVLESLGLEIRLTPEQVGHCLDEAGIGFMFAQAFHPAMKYVAPVRGELGVRTIFNLLGPLTNPAGARYQVLGVPRRELVPLLAETLLTLGVQRAMVVHGEPGLDELSTLGPTLIAEVQNGDIRTYTITPEEFGITSPPESEIEGGSAEMNAGLLTSLLRGENRGPKRDFLLLNAAASFVVSGLAEDLREGLVCAGQTVDSGAAWAKVEELLKLIPRQTVS